MEKRNILVVAHDAGGSEIISSWIRRTPDNIYSYILEGPAIKIFESKLGTISSLPIKDLPNFISTFDLVLTGTSWGSDIEKITISIAREHKIKVASFLDHWVNYLSRFTLYGQSVFPDQIWVGDEYAEDLVRKLFPSIELILVPNPYFLDIEDDLIKVKMQKNYKHSGINILYVSEPISDCALKFFNKADQFGYTEIDAIENYLSSLNKFILGYELNAVRIRPHPSENPDKFDYILSKFKNIKIEISRRNSLLEDCLWSDWVVGCESMAMVVGLIAKRKVFSSIPDAKMPCGLPHKDIIRLFQ